MRPWFMTARRSDIVSASSWSWVTYRKVIPTCFCSAPSSTWSVRRSLASSAPSGSSSSRTDGRSTSARASATRCCWPPDSWLGRRFSYPVSWTIASASATRPFALGLGHRLVLHAEGDVLGDRQEREQRVALEDRVDVAAVGCPAPDVGAVEQDLSAGRRLEARHHAQRGRLAAAARARAARRTRRPGSRPRSRRLR